jgi:hypothetical protein
MEILVLNTGIASLKFEVLSIPSEDSPAGKQPKAGQQRLDESKASNPIPIGGSAMIRKLSSGKYRLYSRVKDAKTGRRKNLGTFNTRQAAEKHERAVQYFKHKH